VSSSNSDVMVRIALDPDEWVRVRVAAAEADKPLRVWLADLVRAALAAEPAA